MIRCMIIDDEPLAVKVVSTYLASFEDLEITDTCKDAIEGFNKLSKNPADVIFLDINMPVMTGLDFLKNLENPPIVVVTTAYREYAVESYELDVIDYLVKPFSFNRFMKSIDRVRKRLQLIQSGPPPLLVNEEDGTFQFFKIDKRMVKVYFDDILYIESLKDYVRIKTKDDNLVNHNNLIGIAELLPQKRFIRIHRSYIIPIDKVKAIDGNRVEIDGKLLPIGRNYQRTVKKAIFDQEID